jgi:hypothetical protein
VSFLPEIASLAAKKTRVTCSPRDPPGATRCPSINKNLVAATFPSRAATRLLFSGFRTPCPRNSAPSASLRCPCSALLSLSTFNGRSSPFLYFIASLLHCILTSLLRYFVTSLLRYFVSSSRKHSSNVFTANSAWSSSITSGGQNRTVVSPDPRISSPLRYAA